MRIRQSVYKTLLRSTKYSQNLVISNVHTVAGKPTAPVSQRERRTAQHTVRNVTNVVGLGISSGFANQRRKLMLRKLLRMVLTPRLTK